MKTWQHGIALDRLRAIAATYERHNSFALSPFAQFKKNDIAEAIHKREFIELGGASYCMKGVSRDTKIVMFQDVLIGIKRAGDLTLTRLNWLTEAGRQHLLEAIAREAHDHNIWLHVFEEDRQSVLFAFEAGFTKIGTKFTSFGEIIGVYFRAPVPRVDVLLRRKRAVPPSELIALKRLDRDTQNAVTDHEISDIMLGLFFTNHYSNYNKRKSWSGLSLRGFSDDTACIIKPSEMSDAWKKENGARDWRLQWTQLADAFAGVRQFCAELSENEDQIQRVRLMKLAPSGGELRRHTDQVDAESGTRERQFLRIHLPIVTNDKVLFTSWGCDGAATTLNMKAGDAYYVDTRKPHMAVNNGASDRIHLVVDVQANRKLLALL